MPVFLYQYRCHKSEQKAKFQLAEPSPHSQYTVTCVLHLSQATSNTFTLQTSDFPDSWWRSAGGEVQVSAACTRHPREKLGEELRCALSSTAPAASEMGTWNLGNEDRGVKFVLTARAQWSRRWAFFFPVLIWPMVTLYQSHISRLTSSIWAFSCGPVKKHQVLTQARAPQCLLWGNSLPRPHYWITDNLMLRLGPAMKFSSNQSSRRSFPVRYFLFPL